MSTRPANDNRHEKLLAASNAAVEMAAVQMSQAGASPEMIIDRLLTYGAALACSLTGSATVAQEFRRLADRIASGVFDGDKGNGRRH